MYDLSRFRLRDMVQCAAALRAMGDGAASLGEVAERTVRHLYEECRDESGQPACALVRFFKTHRFRDLAPDLRDFVRGNLGRVPEDPLVPCLILLGTAGDRPEWNDPEKSRGHRAIPLLSPQMVEQFPMISQLVKQLGLDVAAIIRPDPRLLVDRDQKTYNVFHVPEALDSPHIPAQQDFVRRFGIRSVLGFGGILPEGELFAIILFSKVGIPAQTAQLFTTVALGAKVALLEVADAPLFVTHDGS